VESQPKTEKTRGRGGAARTMGEILSGAEPAKARRTFQPVRRNSYNIGEREARWYRRVNPKTIGARLRAAERFNDRMRRRGERIGPLGEIGLETLRLFYRTICHRSGRLDPSIDYICRTLRRCRKAVVAALARLKRHGFLDWIRRSEPSDTAGEKGPQVVQITNAYVLLDPNGAGTDAMLVVPLPDDVAQAQAEASDELTRMRDQLSTTEVIELDCSDPGLKGTLLSFAKTAGWA